MKFEIYKDNLGEHRWRLRRSSGQLLAVSGKGYNSKLGYIATIDSVKKGSQTANTVLQETISSWK